MGLPSGVVVNDMHASCNERTRDSEGDHMHDVVGDDVFYPDGKATTGKIEPPI